MLHLAVATDRPGGLAARRGRIAATEGLPTAHRGAPRTVRRAPLDPTGARSRTCAGARRGIAPRLIGPPLAGRLCQRLAVVLARPQRRQKAREAASPEIAHRGEALSAA